MENDLDKKLYNEYLNGEKHAFEYLYNKYKNKIEYFIFNIVKDYQKAEDLTQDTFIYVMTNPMHEDTSFKYYLYLVAKSKSYNYINVEKRRNEINELNKQNEILEKNILEIIIEAENKKELLDSINQLDDKYKNAIYLSKIEGLSYEETAKILGQTISNTKTLIHRGKKDLRKILLRKGFYEMNKKSKIILILFTTIITLSGIVFSKEIEKIIKELFNFGLGEGINTAAENDYISTPTMDPIEFNATITNSETLVHNINTKVKINNYLMDDYNLSVEFNFEFDNKIKDYFDFNQLNNIILNDLIILDENKQLIYVSNYIKENSFNDFCDKNQLNYTYKNFNEHYMNNGLNNFPRNVDNNSNIITLIYNMYSNGYPKSKKLEFYFKEITLINNDTSKNITLSGNWNIQIDVPEKMYNRKNITYKVIDCSNKDFNITTAFATDTGFELGIIINNMPNPPYYLELVNEEIQKEINEGKITSNEINTRRNDLLQTQKYQELISQYYPIKDDYDNKSELTNTSYIENENGQKFVKSFSPSRKQDCNFIYGDKFSYYETFELTKYDLTDKLKVQIMFKNTPVIIELEKN